MSYKMKDFLCSSIGKKQLMGVTGLLLCGFSLSHLLGNLTLLFSSDAFNIYGHTLTSNPLIYVAEFGLAAIFLTHIVLATKLSIENKQARPQSYYMVQKGGEATVASSYMPISGFLLLVFLIMHLINFKFGTMYYTVVDGVEMRDLYKTVQEHFQSPANVGLYVGFMIVLGMHVYHGFWSAFQSIGFNHPKYMPKLKIASLAFSFLVAGGFSSLAIFMYFAK